MALQWDAFLDKVYGCWIGKCVSGTIGAPYEGYKGIMNVDYTPELFAQTLPNDDLDLQVLWLEVIENVGPGFTSNDLAKIFYEKCPYSPGEYATFKKNYELGIKPPLSGKHNNQYYLEGMGCPIRSEIWACMAPGDPELAAKLAYKDGCLDHWGESIIAEQYMSALEALAFTEKPDTKRLIIKALEYIDPKSKFYGLVSKVVEWCDESDSWKYVFGKILRDYGHPDCTNMFQNMGIVIMALLMGKNDFIETTMLALNCGFDTDCTCATVGSVIGIMNGGEALMKKHNLSEQVYKLSVNTTRRSDKVYDLAVDVAKAALLFAEIDKKSLLKGYDPNDIPVINGNTLPIDFTVSYPNDDPTIAPGESKVVTIKLEPGIKIKASGVIKFTAPDYITVKPAEKPFKIGGLFESDIEVTVTAQKDAPVLLEKNIIKCDINIEGRTQVESFGIVGVSIWKAYGPFWENTTYAPPPKALESYYSHLGGGKDGDETMDILRQFHINMKADWDKEYLEEQLLGNRRLGASLSDDPAYEGFPVYFKEDRFSFSDIMTNDMPCVMYLVRDVFAAEETTCCLQVGHSDVFRLWMNGDLLAYSDNTDNWTPENIHKNNIILKKGLNRFVAKLARTNGATNFSIMFTKNGTCTDMLSCLGSGQV